MTAAQHRRGWIIQRVAAARATETGHAIASTTVIRIRSIGTIPARVPIHERRPAAAGLAARAPFRGVNNTRRRQGRHTNRLENAGQAATRHRSRIVPTQGTRRPISLDETWKIRLQRGHGTTVAVSQTNGIEPDPLVLIRADRPL